LDSRRYSANDIYLNHIKEYGKNNSFFIYTDVNQYVNFPHKNLVQPLYINSIQNLFEIINSCKLFCGNLSAPMAIAYALMKNIICEFGYVDMDSYRDEIKYYDNILIGE
jgi:ADP-heptose:LPS heptosyltransferase